MRRLLPMLLAALAPVGCLPIKSNPKPQPPNTEKIVERKAEDFVTYLNRQAGYTRTVRYNELNLKATIPGQPFVPALNNGSLVCSQPNNLRMKAGGGPVIGPQLDVGANDAEMWMAVKAAEEKYLYVPNAEFASVQDALPVKFETGWVMQALGMAAYDPNKQYTVTIDEKNRAYLLSYPDVTAGGLRVRKTVEFAADQMGGTAPQIRRHIVTSEDGKKVIAEAKVRRVVEQVLTDPETRKPIHLFLPTELVLEWPAEQTKMDLILGKVKVNEQMTAADFDDDFRKPPRLFGHTPKNLADMMRGLPRK